MRSFIKNILSTTLGVFLAIGLILLFGFVFIIGLVASSSTSASIKSNSVLYIPLSGVMEEQAISNPLNDLLGNGTITIGLNELCKAIDKAKGMDEIKGIYIDAGILLSDPASLEELRRHLSDFKKSGKFILSYADAYTQGGYYLCSVANRVMLNPSGELDWKGLAAQPMFYKDLLEKFGVKMQVFRVGTFKSYVEPYTSTEMSEPNREQVTSYMNSIWNNFVSQVSVSRHISKDLLQSYADQYTGFAPAEELVKKNLVDTLTYVDGAKSVLKKYAGIKADTKLNLVSASDICSTIKDDVNDNNQIAVYYACGDIVDEIPDGFSQQSFICGSTVVKDMEELANDDNVKAVVLRINSGGGSAYASEQMWHAIKQLNKKKPVVVSMSGLAASGGYYMSSAGSYIFAEPTTLTGSIGIFGMIPDVSALMKEKLGLRFDCVKTNKLSDFGSLSSFGSMARSFTAEEKDILQRYIDRGYALFLNRVAEGRKISPASVDSIAQGRVWTGEQAVKIGLVDKLGSLKDAVNYAAKKAKLKESFSTVEYPELSPWYLSIIDQVEENYYETHMRSSLGEYYKPFVFLKTLSNQSYIQARIFYSSNIY